MTDRASDDPSPHAAVWNVLRTWLERDAVGRAILALMATEPVAAASALEERLQRTDVPPTLMTYVMGGRVDTLVNVATVHGSIDLHRRAPARPVPHELPPDLVEFTGRRPELGQLRRALKASHRANNSFRAVLHGMAGVGKSTLAIHIGHQLAQEYPDGQLYIDLHGSVPGPRPVDPIVALSRILQSLGEAADDLPNELDAAANHFRTRTSDSRFLLVLDNAASAEQVLPLLPSSRYSAVLITTRRALPSTESAPHVRLEPLPEKDSLDLLTKIVGQRPRGAELDFAKKITQLCGYLPLALRLAAARTRRYRARPFEQVALRLESVHRLDELQDEHIGIRASLSGSYDELTQSDDLTDRESARVLRYLGMLDLPSMALYAVGSLVDESPDTVIMKVERLLDAELLESRDSGRYGLHDLVRVYARSLANSHESESSHADALLRLVEFYDAMCRRISHLLQPSDTHRGHHEARSGIPVIDDEQDAALWLDAEASNIVALIRQASNTDRAALQARVISLGLAAYWPLRIRGLHHQWRAADEAALETARRLGDHKGEAYLLGDLADVLRRLGDVDQARYEAEQAIELFTDIKDDHGLARTYNLLGNIHTQHGSWNDGTYCYETAVGLYRSLGDLQGETNAMGNLSLVAAEQGHLDDAYRHLTSVLEKQEQFGDLHTKATVLVNLAELSIKRNRADEAVAHSNQALEAADELGDPNVRAMALNLRGEGYRLNGHGNLAIEDQHAAIAIAEDRGQLYSIAEGYWRLGLALHDLGERRQARICWEHAWSMFNAIGAPEATTVRELLAEAK